ncbi:hypothetical protein SAMN05920897_1621, partial [Alkalispirochaeta americana]
LLQLVIPFVMFFAVAKITPSPSGTEMQVKQMLPIQEDAEWHSINIR